MQSDSHPATFVGDPFKIGYILAELFALNHLLDKCCERTYRGKDKNCNDQ